MPESYERICTDQHTSSDQWYIIWIRKQCSFHGNGKESEASSYLQIPLRWLHSSLVRCLSRGQHSRAVLWLEIHWAREMLHGQRKKQNVFMKMGIILGALSTIIIILISDPVISCYNITPETAVIAKEFDVFYWNHYAVSWCKRVWWLKGFCGRWRYQVFNGCRYSVLVGRKCTFGLSCGCSTALAGVLDIFFSWKLMK